MRRMMTLMAVGAAVGCGVVMAVGPDVIAWWSRPLVPSLGACDGAIHAATSYLVKAQLVAAGVFAVLFIAADFYVTRRRARTAPAAALQPGPKA